jgi:hypothetical protein
MAIIRCPSCNKRISNKNKSCPHCHLDLSDSGEGLSYDDASQRVQRERAMLLANHGYAALGLTTAGAIWCWFVSDGMSRPPGFWPVATVAAGAMWYIGVRVLMIVKRLRK